MTFASAFPEKLDALEEKLEEDDYEEELRSPYSFSWAAARYYNGDPDREHQEQRGEDGITRGVYRWVIGEQVTLKHTPHGTHLRKYVHYTR